MKPLTIILMVLLLTSLSGCVGIVDSETKEALLEIERQYKANDRSKSYDEVRASVIGEWSTGAIKGSVEIFEQDESIHNPLLIFNISEGYGSYEMPPNKPVLYSRTTYKTGFNGKQEYYDQWYKGSSKEILPEYTTVTNTIPYTTLIFENAVKVGAINSWNFIDIDEHKVQNIDLDNNTRFIFEIYVGGNGAKIKNPVISFVNDLSTPFEYTEFGDVTLELISGLDMNAPQDITEIIKSGSGNVPIGEEINNDGDRWINAGSYARYRLTFHDINHAQLTKTDTMNVYLDDLNGYRHGDIFRFAKAESVHIAKIFTSNKSSSDTIYATMRT